MCARVCDSPVVAAAGAAAELRALRERVTEGADCAAAEGGPIASVREEHQARAAFELKLAVQAQLDSELQKLSQHFAALRRRYEEVAAAAGTAPESAPRVGDNHRPPSNLASPQRVSVGGSALREGDDQLEPTALQTAVLERRMLGLCVSVERGVFVSTASTTTTPRCCDHVDAWLRGTV